MGRIPDLTKIQPEDFDADMQDTIDKLAYPLNIFMEKVTTLLNKNIDFFNLNQEIINLSVAVDVTGKPTILTQYKTTLKSKVIGNVCISALNTVNGSTYPTGQPFLSFTQNGLIVTINNVTGLQPSQKYNLTILSIGQ